jgi:excisionase family DNA binding protein
MNQRLVASVDEAASMLGIGRNLAYQLIHQNKLPHRRLGSRIVIPLKSIDKFLNEHDPQECMEDK